MKSCIYRGWVRHRRNEPFDHRFRYPLYMVCLDLSELDEVFRGRLLWSTRRPALAWFRRADYYGDRSVPLDRAVRERVSAALGRPVAGKVLLLTNLRCLGYVQNPASFYLCYDESGARLEAVMLEITNTPWGERFSYVMPASGAHDQLFRFGFDKDFHVSPFMPMEQAYEALLRVRGRDLVIHMRNTEQGRLVFDASLVLARHEITTRSLARTMLRHPFMTGRVVLGIYWQALRLWLRGAPFHPHPRRRRGAAPATTEEVSVR